MIHEIKTQLTIERDGQQIVLLIFGRIDPGEEPEFRDSCEDKQDIGFCEIVSITPACDSLSWNGDLSLDEKKKAECKLLEQFRDDCDTEFERQARVMDEYVDDNYEDYL